MHRFSVKRPSAGMVVAFVALIAATSGTAVALPGNNSVNSGDIKNNSITGSDVKNSSLKSADVKNGSLLSSDFKAGQIPAGPTSAAGPTGPAKNALAFAHVHADGTIDGALSKNMAVQADNSYTDDYCLIVPPGSRNIVATIDSGEDDNDYLDGVATVSLDPDYIHDYWDCPSTSNAIVVTFSPYYVGGTVNLPVFVTVN